MNIGIDISSLIYGRGVSRYTSNLVRALLKQKNINLTLYGSSWRQKRVLKTKAEQLLKKNKSGSKHNLYLQSYPPSLQAFLWQFGFNKIKQNLPKIDIFHSWDWLQPPDKDLPLVSTIHDLAILKFPEYAHPKILKAHQKSWKILRERQAQIIAVSRATKKDIVEILRIPSWQVHVIQEALPAEVKQISENLSEDDYQLIKKRLKLDKPFILFVGTREPRKNLDLLIRAWMPLAKDYELIIAGESGWDETSSKKFKAPSDKLKFLGRVTDSELSVLYGEASLFAYPSLYEGFGLPILEAFYHGTPVVTSNVSSMLEVAGNAAELIEPESVQSIRQGIEKVLNESISEQQKRLQRMIIRLQMFNWDRVAKETIKVYEKAIDL